MGLRHRATILRYLKYLENRVPCCLLTNEEKIKNNSYENNLPKYAGTKEKMCFVCTADMKYFYHSLERTTLRKLRQLLKLSLVAFPSRTGIEIDDLLDLIDCYVR